MNPFKTIDPQIGLLKNPNGLFYGCFYLNFDQVQPLREHPIGKTLIKVKTKDLERVQAIYKAFPAHLKYEIKLHHQQKVKNNKSIGVNCFKEEDWFLSLSLFSDACYVNIYNFYFALLQLSPYLEDCYFFIHASGGRNEAERWMDEYKIKDGKLLFNRNTLESEAFFGALVFYLKKALRVNTPEFKKFALFMLYDCLFIEVEKTTLRKGEYYSPDMGMEVSGLFWDYQEKIEMMTQKELKDINTCLKKLINSELSENLKKQLEDLYHFNQRNEKMMIIPSRGGQA